MTTALIPSVIESIDSYFMWCRGRIQTVNSAREVIGVVDSGDWPPSQITPNAFYLLLLGSVQVEGVQSAAVPVYVHTLQWQWLVMGTDLTEGIRGRNRGDRYRIAMAMRNEIRIANFPHYTEKLIFTPDSAGALQSASLAEPEAVWWTAPRFNKRVDRESGNIYDTATIEITDMTPIISS